MRSRQKNEFYRKIAKERVDILFSLAGDEFGKHDERSRRYVQLARKIGLRYNVRLPKTLKRSFCKDCNTLLVPGRTCIVRTNSKEKTVRIKCLNCGGYSRYAIKK